MFITSSCTAFFAHWLALPRTAVIPHFRTFIDDAPLCHMPFTLIYELMPEGFLIRFMGTGLAEFWRRDLTGALMSEQKGGSGLRAIRRNAELILRHSCGMRQINQSMTALGLDVCFELVMLPLAVDSGRPSRIVAFTQFQSDRDDEPHIPDAQNVKGQPEWLDTGMGVPAKSPRTMDLTNRSNGHWESGVNSILSPPREA